MKVTGSVGGPYARAHVPGPHALRPDCRHRRQRDGAQLLWVGCLDGLRESLYYRGYGGSPLGGVSGCVRSRGSGLACGCRPGGRAADRARGRDDTGFDASLEGLEVYSSWGVSPQSDHVDRQSALGQGRLQGAGRAKGPAAGKTQANLEQYTTPSTGTGSPNRKPVVIRNAHVDVVS